MRKYNKLHCFIGDFLTDREKVKSKIINHKMNLILTAKDLFLKIAL